MVKKLEAWEKHSNEYGPLFSSLITFNRLRTCIEIGVARGTTTAYLCEAVRNTGGHVYGFDAWDKHGTNLQFEQIGSKEIVENYLKEKGFNKFTLIKINSRKCEEFAKILKSYTPTIDFAFIDGDHSYEGIKNDFMVVYPLLAENGMIAFHDTLRISGCREFILDLRTTFFDGTYDIVDFPFGNGDRRVGVSLLVKRTYPILGISVDEDSGSRSGLFKIYKREQEWFKKQQLNAQKKITKKGIMPPVNRRRLSLRSLLSFLAILGKKMR